MIGLLSANSSSPSFIDEVVRFFNFAKNAFLGFRIEDAFDILILTLIFTFCFRFLKRKKAGALILGIAICLVVNEFAKHFELWGISYIFSGIVDIGPLALVIIFAPELREIFEKLGAGSLKGIKTFGQDNKKQKQYQNIKDITKAIHMLSVEKTGALIVFARTTQLDDVIHSGITINADISDSLIRNLFYNKAPLHDGAVVIDGDRVVAASCILPLPRRCEVDPDLGTRHRAAVGLSEVSDALIVVVSEETGIISVAKECELIRGFTADSLRKYLMRELLKTDREEEI